MPKIICKCAKCGGQLDVVDSNVDCGGDIQMRIAICKDTNCYDCSACEDAQTLKKISEFLHT
jgi:hypothetical protein